MNTNTFYKKELFNLINLQQVHVKMTSNPVRRFEIKSIEGRKGKSILNDCQELAEIKSAGSDYFATFSTEIGDVTYIFCEFGAGYKIGPGNSQQKFTWH